MSSILQYLSFETVESMLYQMKTLKLNKLKEEFLMLTVFHGRKFCTDIDNMDIDESIKEGFHKLVNEFLRDLLEVSEFDPDNELNKSLKSEVEGAQQYSRPIHEI